MLVNTVPMLVNIASMLVNIALASSVIASFFVCIVMISVEIAPVKACLALSEDRNIAAVASAVASE